MWQRFTERARKVIFFAQEEAQKFGEGYVSSEHLLLGLLRERRSAAMTVLERLNVSSERVRTEIEKQLPKGDETPGRDMTLTPRGKRIIDLAYDEARHLNNNYIGTEHLLLGLIREESGLGELVLKKLGAELDKARELVLELQGGSTPPPPKPKVRPVARLLLLMALGETDGAAAKFLRELGVNVAQLQYQLELADQVRSSKMPEVSIDSILEVASGFAAEQGPLLDSGHVLLAIIQLQAEPVLENFLTYVSGKEVKQRLNEFKSKDMGKD